MEQPATLAADAAPSSEPQRRTQTLPDSSLAFTSADLTPTLYRFQQQCLLPMAPRQLLLPALLLLPAHLSSPMQQHTSRCPGSPQGASLLVPAHTEREVLLALRCTLRMIVKPGCEHCFCMPFLVHCTDCSCPAVHQHGPRWGWVQCSCNTD